MARRRRKGKARQVGWRGCSRRFSRVPALYLAAALIGSLVPVNRGWVEPADGTTIYIADNGIHADIIMPVRRARPGLGAADPDERFRRARIPNAALDRLRLGRGAGLSRHADLVGHHAAHDLVRADRRQAGDARRICVQARITRCARSACGRRNIAGCGPRSAPTSTLDAERPAAADRPSRLRPVRRLLPGDRQGQRAPHLQQPWRRAGCGSPA